MDREIMDREIIEEKLESLRHCIGRVRERRPATADVFLHDYDLQDIVALNLSRAVQLCVDVGAHIIAGGDLPAPDSMSETFDAMAQTGILDRHLADRMKKAVGFRNVAVHSYRSIDWAIVHAICQNQLGDFDDFARAVVSHMESN
jgi:uncharacterized protein YutE (UPF0331/DUF86 family)